MQPSSMPKVPNVSFTPPTAINASIRRTRVAALCMGIYMLFNEWNQYWDLSWKKWDMEQLGRRIKSENLNRAGIDKASEQIQKINPDLFAKEDVYVSVDKTVKTVPLEEAEQIHEQKKIDFKKSVDNSFSLVSLYYKNSDSYKSQLPKKN